MKSFAGFSALLMLAMLFVDVTTYESLGRTVFHLVLFFGSIICMNIDD